MHERRVGPRHVPKAHTFASAEVERVALWEALATASGVVFMGLIEPHLKGGHRASLEIDRDLLDEFIAHIASQGWMDGF